MTAFMSTTTPPPAQQHMTPFEKWYVENTADLNKSPIGCRDCGLQRAAWLAGFLHARAQDTEPQGSAVLDALRACEAFCNRVIDQEGGVLWGVDFHALRTGVRRGLAAAQGAAPQARIPEWIPVSERLPEVGQDVAFVVDCKNPSWAYLHGRVLGGRFTGDEFGIGGFSVPGLTVKASFWKPMDAAPQPTEGTAPAQGD